MPNAEVQIADLNKTTKTDVFKVDPRRIEVNHDKNPRKEYGDIESLAAFIKESGTDSLPAILVRRKASADGQEAYELVHGYRRMTAVRTLLARGHEVPRVNAKVIARGYTEADEIVDHLTQNSGKPLTAVEEAGIYLSLQLVGWTQKQIAAKVGKTQPQISLSLKLAKLAVESEIIGGALNAGTISAAAIYGLCKDLNGDTEAIEARVTSALSNLAGERRVSVKSICTIRQSHLRSMFEKSIKHLEHDAVDVRKIAKLKALFDPFIDAVDTSANAENLADAMLELV